MKHTPMLLIWRGVAGLAMVVALNMGSAHAQAVFATPEAAADAMVDAIARNDDDAVKRVLGPEFRRFVPAGSVAREDVYSFLGAWAKRHAIETSSPSSANLVVGDSGWVFPVPLVRTGKGWQFDTRAGIAEMQRRRIGRNELAAIDTLRMLCDAQERYRATAGNGKPAARLVSRPGRQDGLYWPVADEANASPLGADALVMQADVPADAAFHGYRFAVAPAKDDGCAFVAWPAVYGTSGVRSFAIGSDRQVMERDFGRRTNATDYGKPRTRDDAGWTLVSR
ncbi:DUF2950 family protein [Noviherbaspirillum cavernae]|uniref:DUF2950 family protein n=1 Tax=Noviherbaspirillum cavernae TaxID=2320862 RepID=A0A418WZP5_9BURK|nr:DUF2950 family protein [Noviherbaspirillum cavernae]RJG05724.1 DUF2950 family protein [Noviherbaspirillum cavernae]